MPIILSSIAVSTLGVQSNAQQVFPPMKTSESESKSESESESESESGSGSESENKKEKFDLKIVGLLEFEKRNRVNLLLYLH